jgi:hypothetical protein
MGGVFGSPPKPPKPDEPPPPPQVDKAATEADERLRLARRQGRKATLFTGQSGPPLTGQTKSATLLGQAG